MNIIASKVISVSATLTTTDTIKIPFNSLSFKPDVCILKSVAYSDEGKTTTFTNGIYKIESSITNDDIYHFVPNITSATYVAIDGKTDYFYQTHSSCPNIELYLMGNTINQQGTFRLKYEDDSTLPTTTSTLSLVIEFRKYK